jgi:hypothetical protein
MLPERERAIPEAALRGILDDFAVGGRLRHIRDFVWRGGALPLEVKEDPALDVAYTLTARWAAAVLERSPAHENGLLGWDNPAIEGRWVRGASGYELRVGIGEHAPSAVYVRASGLLSYVPFLGRPHADVESALQRELELYAQWFTSHCEPVPRAARAQEQRLRQLGLAA